MSRTATYHTTVRWTGEHWGHLVMGNGPEMKFSAPPDAQGHAGVFTPEDAFVAAANTCVMMMFIWASRALQAQAAVVRVPHRRDQAHRTRPDGDFHPAALPPGDPYCLRRLSLESWSRPGRGVRCRLRRSTAWSRIQ